MIGRKMTKQLHSTWCNMHYFETTELTEKPTSVLEECGEGPEGESYLKYYQICLLVSYE